MAMKLKWDVDGKGDEAWGAGQNQYTGEIPPKGSYIAKVKRVTQGKIKAAGENKNKPRLSVLLEIVGGQGSDGPVDPDYEYYGAPVWDGINIIKSQTGRANAFVHALTDGSEEAKRAIENKFWPPNMDVRAEKVVRKSGEEDIHIKSIGPYKINSPNGELLVRIVTKMGNDLEGNKRAEISQYLPYTGPKPKNGKVVDDDDDDDDEILDAELVDDGDDDDDVDDDYEELDGDEDDDDTPF
jgi:hypothetical protein